MIEWNKDVFTRRPKTMPRKSKRKLRGEEDNVPNSNEGNGNDDESGPGTYSQVHLDIRDDNTDVKAEEGRNESVGDGEQVVTWDNGIPRLNSNSPFFFARPDFLATQKLDQFLDRYESEHGLEPVDLDIEVFDLMPKIEALVSLISKPAIASTFPPQNISIVNEDHCKIEKEIEKKSDLGSLSKPQSALSSLHLRLSTLARMKKEVTIIGDDDEGDKEGKDAKSIPRSREMPSPSAQISGILKKSKSPSLRRSEGMGESEDKIPATNKTKNNDILAAATTTTTKTADLQNIDTQEKKKMMSKLRCSSPSITKGKMSGVAVADTEVEDDGNNNNNNFDLSCDKKTSRARAGLSTEAVEGGRRPVTAPAPQRRPPSASSPRRIDNSRRSLSANDEERGGVAVTTPAPVPNPEKMGTGNAKEFERSHSKDKILNGLIGTCQNNQNRNQAGGGGGGAVPSASSKPGTARLGGLDSGIGGKTAKRGDKKEEEVKMKIQTREKTKKVASCKSKIPILVRLPKDKSQETRKEEGNERGRQRWKSSPVNRSKSLKNNKSASEKKGLRSKTRSKVNCTFPDVTPRIEGQQVQEKRSQQKKTVKFEDKKKVTIKNDKPEPEEALKLGKEKIETKEKLKSSIRMPQEVNITESDPSSSDLLLKRTHSSYSLCEDEEEGTNYVATTLKATYNRTLYYSAPDEVSACLDLIEGLSFHTTWVMKKVQEFPAADETDLSSGTRIEEVGRTDTGEFFGVPYVKQQILGEFPKAIQYQQPKMITL